MSGNRQPSPRGEALGGGAGPKSSASILVVAARLVLLLLAAGAVVSAFVLTRGRDRAAQDSGARYVCPMHPEVVETKPAECPICHMALEPVAAPTPGASSGATSASTPSGAALEVPPQASIPLAHGAAPNDDTIVGKAQRRVFVREVRAPAWVEEGQLVAAVVYKEELVGLAPEERGWFYRAIAPAVGIDVQLTADPPIPKGRSTSRILFRLGAGAGALAPGEVGWVKLAARARELLAVPSSALLHSSEGTYVLAASADGHSFNKRTLEMGRTDSGFTVVWSGLGEGERVIVASAFFLEAERRVSEREEMAGALQ